LNSVYIPRIVTCLLPWLSLSKWLLKMQKSISLPEQESRNKRTPLLSLYRTLLTRHLPRLASSCTEVCCTYSGVRSCSVSRSDVSGQPHQFNATQITRREILCLFVLPQYYVSMRGLRGFLELLRIHESTGRKCRVTLVKRMD